MKKKILVGLLVLATVVGIAFAAEKNWCAAAKCKVCGAFVEFTEGAETQAEAEKKAKQWLTHKSNCTAKSGNHVVTRAAVGACPIIED